MFPLSLRLSAIAIFAVPQLAISAPRTTGLPAKLESKARVAFADIAKAKSALNGGDTKTSQSLLAKSQALLKSVLSTAPNPGSAQPTEKPEQQDAQQSTSAVSKAEGELAKLDPSVASKTGTGEGAAQGNVDAGTGGEVQAANGSSQKSVLTELESAYQKVALAQTLLKVGNTSKAKSVLDQIPSSPLGLLKSGAPGL